MDKRLRAAAGLVLKCGTAADIGTDHGYLPVYLIKNGIAKRVIASDVNPLPLLKAEQNVKKNGAQSFIDLRLSFGFDNYKNGEIDCAFICGMGGENIANILKCAKIDLDFPMVLQPMSKPEFLLKFLATNGFALIKHTVVKDRGRYYNIMLVQKQKGAPKDLTDDPLFTVTGKLDLFDPCVKEYLKLKLRSLEKAAAQLNRAQKGADTKDIIKTAKLLKNLLEKTR